MFFSEVQKNLPCGLRILAPRQTQITLENSRHDIREDHDKTTFARSALGTTAKFNTSGEGHIIFLSYQFVSTTIQ